MKQIAQNYKSGELSVLDVPTPICRPGGVLVQSLFSLISTGTEMMKLAEAKMSMVGKARARPDQVRKVLDTVSQQGAVATYKKVMNRLDSYTPLGYSLCGVVVEVGPGAEEFRVGDLVAAAGNEYALHAEYNWVPSNLCAVVPKGVLPEHAAFSTVGAIAMHGVRRAEVQLGDTACVIGLGLVGQLVVRLLVASGVRVTGLDVLEERCRAAEKAGADLCAPPTDEGIDAVQQALGEISGGRGADHLFLAAGGSSNGPVEAAARLARDRAHVVDIGKTRLDLPWNAYYDKELDVRFSRSYGPGRYDDRYELDGIDYPAGYVRWTERRNLECFLDLIARKEIEVETLISGRFPLDQASTVYAGMASGSVNAVGVLLEYPAPADEDRPREISRVVSSPAPAARSGKSGRLAIGFIGAGNYANSMLLPNLAKQDNAYLSHVATTRSLSAVNAQRRFGFTTASTTAEAVLEDKSLDAIFIVTRHHTHADMVCRALETGKAVFVEKPLALTESDLERVIDVIDEDRQRPAHGGLQPPVLAAAGQDAVGVRPAAQRDRPLPGQRGTAGRGQLVHQRGARGLPVHRRGRALHRHAELVDGQPANRGLRARRPGEGRRARHAALRERLDRHDQLHHRRQLALSEGDARRRRGRAQRPAGQLQEGDGLERPEGERHEGPSGQGPGDPAGEVHRGLPHRRADADFRRVAGGHDQGHDRGRREPAEQPPGAGVSGSPVSRLGWYARRIARMSPAEMAWRARDQARPGGLDAHGKSGTSRPWPARRLPACPGSAPCCPRAPPRRYPSRPGRPCSTPRAG